MSNAIAFIHGIHALVMKPFCGVSYFWYWLGSWEL